MHALGWVLALYAAARCFGYVDHGFHYYYRNKVRHSNLMADGLFEDEAPKRMKGDTVTVKEPPIISKGISDNCDDELDEYFTSFMKIFDGSNDSIHTWDYETAQNLHLQILLTLVKSDTQDREIEQSLTLIRFPNSYIIALEFIQLILKKLKSDNSTLFPAASLIYKKEGLKSTSKSIVSMKDGSKTMIPYEIVSVKRKTERCLSLLFTLLITFRSCQYIDSHSSHPTTVFVDNFLYFSKIILEKLPMHEKHLSFLTYCRGVIVGNFNEKRNNLLRKMHGGVNKIHQNQINESNMKRAYLDSFNNVGMSQPSALLRLVYPLLYTAYTIYVRDTNDDDVFDSNAEHPCNTLAPWLKRLIESDRGGTDSSSVIEGTAENVLHSINKLFNSILALHFINDYSHPDTLSKAVRENTIAMEVLCTHKAFCEAYYSDSYTAVLRDIGAYINLMIKLQDQPSAFVINTKKVIAIIDVCGRSNSLKYLQPLLDVAPKQFLPQADRTDDNIFVDLITKKRHRKDKPTADPLDDSLFWVDGKVNKVAPRGLGTKLQRPTKLTTPVISSLQSNSPVSIDKVLLRLVAMVVGVETKVILGNPSAIFEIFDTFTTWRKPQLLLEYCSMHSSSPEVQNLFRRFLRALWGLSNETVDDIRYKDEGNLRHLKMLPPQLLNDWIEGRLHDTGKLLPGYTDPQTIFMMGEDSNTCMGIRSRQKGTNRGLLSFLLHGNNRILGVKDASGKLIARATVLLLFDIMTNQPVLFVETPYTCNSYQYGSFEDVDNDDILEIYDQAAELGQSLQIPVVYSVPPPTNNYVMSENETPAIKINNDYIDSFLYKSTEATMVYNNASHPIDSTSRTDAPVYNVVYLADYTCLAPYVWIEGVKNPMNTNIFLPNHFPSLVRREKNRSYVPAGIRTIGTLEAMPFTSSECTRGTSHGPNTVSTAIGNSQKLKLTNQKSLQEKLIERKNALLLMAQQRQLNRPNHSDQEDKTHNDDDEYL